ncbi:GNAT family N-acetyltransferase [Arthrobacter sp. Sr33]
MSQASDLEEIIRFSYPTDPETPQLRPEDLTELTTQKLLRLCDKTFQELDHEYPVFGAQENYRMILEEIQLRSSHARTDTAPIRATVRDHIAETRFEVFVGGEVAGALDYRISEHQMWILRTAVDEQYDSRRLDTVLLETALHSAHRRRIAVIPLCPLARQYLISHPHYLPLVPETHSYTLLAS